MTAALSTRLPALFAEHQAHFVYAEAPKLVYWEATQACALACVHCRAEALAQRNPWEMSTEDTRSLLRQIASFDGPPHLVITGGDPLQRPDLFELIDYGRSLDLSVSVTPAGTPDLTGDVIRRFKDAGVASLALSLDGSTADFHDAFRGVEGSFQWTLAGARAIIAEGIPLQINTMVTAQTLDDIPHIHELVKGLGITRWALFFLIATGRGSALAEVSPAEGERLLNWLGQINRSPETAFMIKTTEAHHYRRIVAQKMLRHMPEETLLTTPLGRGFGIRDGNGIVFVSHLGQVFPSGFLPLRAGNIRTESLVDIYRHSDLFRSLRDPEQLRGKCGDCSFRTICGGSRARAYAATGDPLESDPLCPYQPREIQL
jgi:AdoMet-dependent heme synthase